MIICNNRYALISLILFGITNQFVLANEFVKIPGGCYAIGNTIDTNVIPIAINPPRKVCFDSFFIQKYPVTQKEFSEKNLKNHPEQQKIQGSSYYEPWTDCFGDCTGKNPNFPATRVNHEQAEIYCEELGGKLPTQEQYEYALRAGTTTRFFWGDSLKDACQYGNLGDSARKNAMLFHYFPDPVPCNDGYSELSEVGKFKPNPFGLFDMYGNVHEWSYGCFDVKDINNKNPSTSKCGKYPITGASYLTHIATSMAHFGRFGISEHEYDIFWKRIIGFRCVKNGN